MRVPLALTGRSMAGLLPARCAQWYGGELAALTVFGPAIGAWGPPGPVHSLDEIPDTPITPAALWSRRSGPGARRVSVSSA
ncbi:hypothetical protein [Streptomyces sp. NPDC047043]|uniref:hypothetical protein n=1 Tax=Streptomyces sp. NPDC047043 TaxID=3154497 RepID=UPI0033E4DAD8